MKILVTGSTGFIGSNLCRALLERGHTVRAFHRPSSQQRLLDELNVEHVLGDLTQPETLETAMEGVEVVFHTAAWLGGSEQSGRQYAVTVEGTRSLLNAARKAGVRRVVHTSSVAALGVPEPGGRDIPLMNERHTWNYRPDYYPYGYAKYLAELEVQKVVAQGLDVVITNPTLVFGAGDLHRQAGSIITQVANHRISYAINGGINCIHIEDVIDGHLLAMEKGRCGERYILGGENLTYLEMLRMIAEVTRAPAPNLVLPTGLVRAAARPAGMLQSFLNLPVAPELLRLTGLYFYYDLAKANSELEMPARRPVKEAIAAAYAWFTQIR